MVVSFSTLPSYLAGSSLRSLKKPSKVGTLRPLLRGVLLENLLLPLLSILKLERRSEIKMKGSPSYPIQRCGIAKRLHVSPMAKLLTWNKS